MAAKRFAIASSRRDGVGRQFERRWCLVRYTKHVSARRAPRPASAAMNGEMDARSGGPPRDRNYRLVVDPFLVRGGTKQYRYEGAAPAAPPPPPPKDPRLLRSRNNNWPRSSLDPLDLPLPR